MDSIVKVQYNLFSGFALKIKFSQNDLQNDI